MLNTAPTKPPEEKKVALKITTQDKNEKAKETKANATSAAPVEKTASAKKEVQQPVSLVEQGHKLKSREPHKIELKKLNIKSKHSTKRADDGIPGQFSKMNNKTAAPPSKAAAKKVAIELNKQKDKLLNETIQQQLKT